MTTEHIEAGTRVRIKPEIRKMDMDSNKVLISTDMKSYAGKDTTIMSVIHGKRFPEKVRYFMTIDRGTWFWTREMFDVIKG